MGRPAWIHARSSSSQLTILVRPERSSESNSARDGWSTHGVALRMFIKVGCPTAARRRIKASCASNRQSLDIPLANSLHLSSRMSSIAMPINIGAPNNEASDVPRLMNPRKTSWSAVWCSSMISHLEQLSVKPNGSPNRFTSSTAEQPWVLDHPMLNRPCTRYEAGRWWTLEAAAHTYRTEEDQEGLLAEFPPRRIFQTLQKSKSWAQRTRRDSTDKGPELAAPVSRLYTIYRDGEAIYIYLSWSHRMQYAYS